MVRMRHVRQAAGCARGTMAFFRRHGLDLHRFCASGLPAEEIEATGDAMAIRIAAMARAEAGRG